MNRIKSTDYEKINWDDILEVNDINIDPSLPVEVKYLNMKEKTPHTNCYKHGEFKVIMTHNGEGQSFSERTELYMKSLFQPSV
ncbi:MAG: DUF6870 family protein [Peptoniphilaceae bacterium]